MYFHFSQKNSSHNTVAFIAEQRKGYPLMMLFFCKITWSRPYSFNSPSVILLLRARGLFLLICYFTYVISLPKYLKNKLVFGNNKSQYEFSYAPGSFFLNDEAILVTSERKVSQIICTFSHPLEFFLTSRYLTQK